MLQRIAAMVLSCRLHRGVKKPEDITNVAVRRSCQKKPKRNTCLDLNNIDWRTATLNAKTLTHSSLAPAVRTSDHHPA
jgi:hypothetical protein